LLTSLQGEIKQGMDTRFRPANLRHDAEQFATGLDLIHRIETAAGQICQKSSPVHRALLLIANRHAGATP
jgi:hypothetical protein